MKGVSAPLFEDKPRWPGAPRVCLATNMLAFETLAAWEKFHRENGPSCKVRRVWRCETCGRYHADTVAPDPAGGSSGTGRSSKHYAV